VRGKFGWKDRGAHVRVDGIVGANIAECLPLRPTSAESADMYQERLDVLRTALSGVNWSMVSDGTLRTCAEAVGVDAAMWRGLMDARGV